MLAVSKEVVLLYWSIGRDLSRRFDYEGWGTKINERLSKDLQAAFRGVEGFSPRNLSVHACSCRRVAGARTSSSLGGPLCRELLLQWRASMKKQLEAARAAEMTETGEGK